MKNIKSIILILLIAVGILFYINPLLKKTSTVVETAEIKTEVLTGTNFFKGSWAELLKKAKKENKLVFVDLYFTGCAPCAQMDAKVFPNKEVSTILNNQFISFKTDIFKEEIGKKLSMKYAVTGFPTFLFLTSNGKILDISSGFHSTEELIAILSSTQKKATEKIYKKYSPILDLEYPEFYKAAYIDGKRNVSFETVDNYLKKQKDLGDEIPFVIIAGLGANGIYADYIIENASQLAKDYSRMQIRNLIIKIIGKYAKTYGKKENQETFSNALEKVKPIFTEQEWLKFEKIFQSNFKKHNS